jgi:hypothetical protein
MATKHFGSSVQDLVYNIDVGVGLRLVQFGLYSLFVVIIILIYTATQFRAFDEPEAMEYAQLARNMSRSEGMTTQVVRPSTIRFLIEKDKLVSARTQEDVDRDEEEAAADAASNNAETSATGAADIVEGHPQVMAHPDIMHPPVYPAILSAWFKIFDTEFVAKEQGGKYGPELMVVAFAHVCTVLTGIFIWMLGRLLFDNRIGLLGMSIFYLSDVVWQTAISGLNLALPALLVTAAFYFAIRTVVAVENKSSIAGWVVPFIITCACGILMVLTRYALVLIIPALALFFAFGIRKKGWLLSLILIGAVVIGMVPWISRNISVSGSPFGIVPSSIMAGTTGFPGKTFDRAFAPEKDAMKFREVVKAVQTKWFNNTAGYYKDNVRSMGDGILIAFFITTFFYKFLRGHVRWFRWCALLSILLLLGTAGLFGEATIRLTHVFWPIIILYGLAFFFILLDRLNLRLQIQRLSVTTLVILLSVAPLIITLMPPKATFPYPPYLRTYITHISGLLDKSELMCSDVPWATAWYGDRVSLYLPQTLDEFYEINDYLSKISGIYFTMETRNKPFVRGLLNAEQTWFPIIQGSQMPAEFPLKYSYPLARFDQQFVTDRDRLSEEAQKLEVEGDEEAAGQATEESPQEAEEPAE